MTFLGICSIIFDRLSKNGKLFLDATTKHLNEYGEAGLRTLALAYKKLDEADYSAWNEEFSKAKTSIGGDRETMLERLSDVMERDLILVGATAVEDKLQRGVYITIIESRGSISWKFQVLISVSFCFLRSLSALINWRKPVSSSGCLQGIRWKQQLISGQSSAWIRF